MHTHSRDYQSNVFRLYSTSEWRKKLPSDAFPHGNYGLSVGVHPWEASLWHDTDREALLSVLASPEVMMVGEIGLDRSCDVPLVVQKPIFLFQLEVASRCRKPVLLHGVKVQSELLAIRKTFPNVPAWILHGFRGGPEQAAQYLSNGFYLSFGRRYNPASLNVCPANRLFLETDLGGDIVDLYERVAEERKMGLAELESVVASNFRTVLPAVADQLLL